MAAKLSHEPGPLGSQESQHELQEPQELSGSKNNDPNDTECNHLETNMLRLVQAQCNAPYNLGSPPYSRHDPEAAPYNSTFLEIPHARQPGHRAGRVNLNYYYTISPVFSESPSHYTRHRAGRVNN